MRGKSEKGSITIFVLVALLFFMSILLLMYAGNMNRIKTISERAEAVKSIYEKNVNNIDEVYNKRLAKGEETEPEESQPQQDEDDEEEWIDNWDGTFSKGDTTLAIGDYVAYDATKDANGNAVATTSYTSYAEANASNNKNNGRTSGYTEDQVFNVNNYTEGWQVLGVKKGKLLLISAGAINPDMGGKDGKYTLKGIQGYIHGVNELNAIASIFGQGKGAESARSINVEDINKVTGYDPNVTGTGEIYKKGEIDEYRNKVTYSWGEKKTFSDDGITRVALNYSATNGASRTNTMYTSNGFTYYDATKRKFVEMGTNETVTVETTDYKYYPNTLTTSSSGTTKGITKTSIEYKMLFNTTYWLATTIVEAGSSDIYYGLHTVSYSNENYYVYDSSVIKSGTENVRANSLRPVVTLNASTQLIKDENHDGTTKAKAYTLQ